MEVAEAQKIVDANRTGDARLAEAEAIVFRQAKIDAAAKAVDDAAKRKEQERLELAVAIKHLEAIDGLINEIDPRLRSRILDPNEMLKVGPWQAMGLALSRARQQLDRLR